MAMNLLLTSPLFKPSHALTVVHHLVIHAGKSPVQDRLPVPVNLILQVGVDVLAANVNGATEKEIAFDGSSTKRVNRRQ